MGKSRRRGPAETGLEAAIRAGRSDGMLLATDTAAIAVARRLAMCLDQATSPPLANETGIANLTREYRILLAALGLTPKARRELAVDSEDLDTSWLLSGLDIPT